MNSRSDMGGAGSLGGVCLIWLLVFCLVAAWIVVRAANLVIRVMVRHPHSRPLWIALIAFAAASLLVVMATSELTVAIAAGTAVTLVVVARGVELYHEDLFAEPPSLARLKEDVTNVPSWWQVA